MTPHPLHCACTRPITMRIIQQENAAGTRDLRRIVRIARAHACITSHTTTGTRRDTLHQITITGTHQELAALHATLQRIGKIISPFTNAEHAELAHRTPNTRPQP